MVAERGAFSFPTDKGGEVVKEVSFVFIPNLIRKIADVVAEHERYLATTIIGFIYTKTNPIEHQRA